MYKLTISTLGAILIASGLYISDSDVHKPKRLKNQYNGQVNLNLKAPIKTRTSDLEERLFEAYDIFDKDKQEFYSKKIKDICDAIAAQSKIDSMNDYNKFETIFYWFYRNLFKGLGGNETSIIDTLDSGKGNCLTFSLITYLVAKNFNLKPKIVSVYEHVIVSFNYNNKTIDINIANLFGFDIKKYKNRIDRTPMSEDDLVAAIHSNKSGFLNKSGFFNPIDLEQAIIEAKKAIKISKKFALAYTNLGVAYSKLGRLDDALANYEKARKLKTIYPDLYNNFGVVYKLKGLFTRSAINFKKAMRLCYELNIKDETYEKIKQNIEDLKRKSIINLSNVLDFPEKVRDKELFRKFATTIDSAIYKIDFKGDQKAYMDISLGDLIFENKVMISDKNSGNFRLAKRNKSNNEYYFQNQKRVIIKTGTLFYVPWE